MSGIQKEIWLDLLMEGFYPDSSFLSRAVDMSEFVDNNKINLAEAGVDPKVLIDNTNFPIASATRTDKALELPLHTFDTENTIVRNIEEKESSYNKMDSVVRQHRSSLQSSCAVFAAHSWAPSKESDLTPVFKTAGKVNASKLKALSFEDLLQMEARFRMMDVDMSTLVAVLNPVHMADLMAEDMKLYKQMLAGDKIFSFSLFTFSQLPAFKLADGTKAERGTKIDNTTHTQCSLFYSDKEVMRADGTVDVFARYKDPGERGDIIGFQKRFTALPIRNKYTAAIYSDKSL